MYERFFKRLFDFTLSLIALIVLSPILLLLTIIGAIVMQGNPFFTQDRPGKNEKIFKLIKFRTMTDKRDTDENLLPDAERNTKYGLLLRNLSIDELPELFNILKGDMAIIGPRPLLIEYLPYYNEREKHRHDVRPGLTGWAQVNGRNSLSWEDRFEYDVYYTENISLVFDLKILIMTVKKVIVRSDIAENTRDVEGNFAEMRKEQIAMKVK